MKPGELVLARIPQADAQFKLRPALVLCLFLNAIPDTSIAGVLGSIERLRLQRLRRALVNHLQLEP